MFMKKVAGNADETVRSQVPLMKTTNVVFMTITYELRSGFRA